ncbi:MAG TPA: hypothetical protein VH395_13910 [Jatrophihabitantaceae bacterium]
MSGPHEPTYPQQPYPAQQPPPSPAYPQYPQTQPYPVPGVPGPQPGYGTAPERPRLLDGMQHRLARRPVPRVGVSLAGVGVGIAVVGVAVWGITYISDGPATPLVGGTSTAGSSARHFLGAILALMVVAIGYALVVSLGRGPFATAGIAASALGVPVAMQFLTYDASDGNSVNLDATVWVSIAVYVGSYLFVRGARGHTFYLGMSLLLLWVYLLDKMAPTAADIAGSTLQRVFPGSSIGSGGGVSNLSTLGGVSLVLGGAYYLVGYLLDRSQRRGPAVAFVLVGFPAVAVGIAALSIDFKQVGTGIVLLLVGVGIALYGARWNRRFTTWIWAVGAALGGILIVAKIVGSSSTGAAVGIALIILGVLFVVGGALLARAINEPDDAPAEPA